MSTKHELESQPSNEPTLPPQAFDLWAELVEETRHKLTDGETSSTERVEEVLNNIGTVLIEHAATDPDNEPTLVQHRILTAFQGLPNEAGQLESKKLPSINRSVAKYAPNLARIRELDLRPFDEMSLLKATALAGIVRGTEAGQALAGTAIAALRHEITNIMTLTTSTGPRGSTRFLEAYQRIVFASQALNELGAREGSEDFTSVDDNLLLWDALEQRTAEEDIAIPHLEDEEGVGLNDDLVQFRKLTELEQQERLKDLNIIGSKVTELFGDNCEVKYFDIIVFDGDPQASSVDEDVEGVKETEESGEEEEPQSGELFKDYIIAEITQHLENGTDIVHVVAESMHYGNSCYVLRGDILLQMSALTGKQLTWRDVYKERKNTARQLGAQDFRHPKNTDLPGRVLKYLSTNTESILRRIALKWTSGTKPIYDANMEQTRWNRLPGSIRDTIASDPDAARTMLDAWKDTLSTSILPSEIGRIVHTGIETPEPPVGQPAMESTEIENSSLRKELRETKAKLAEAEAKLATLRDVLGK